MTTNDPLSEHTRRRFMQAVAASGAVAGIAGVAGAQAEPDFELDGLTPGWVALAPSEIEGEENPTMELEAGQTYTVTWENGDGLPHNFAVLSADGEQLVRSEVIEEQGVTQTVEFEATEEMAEYYCELHPDTMRGDIEIADAPDAQEDGAPVEGIPIAGDFPEGETIGLQKVAEGFPGLTQLATAPDEEERSYLVTQTGQIYVHDTAPGAAADGPDDGADNETDDGVRNETENGADDRIGNQTGHETDGGVGNETENGAAPGTGQSESVATPEDMEVFLDIQDRIVELGLEDLAGYDERGLLGLAFHPEFEENRRFFVRYSAPPRSGTDEAFDHTDVLAEFSANEDGTSADPDSEQTILEIPQPQDNHNGGRLVFGPDGYLYASVGDGGNVHDIGTGHVEDWYEENEGGNGQDTEQSLLGGIHRIDVDADGEADAGQGTAGNESAGGQGAAGGEAYAIPEDNPLVDLEGHHDEYYAWGFRNPWGMSMDDEGTLFVTDAGQHLVESLYIVERGGNYSWNVKEGSFCFSPDTPVEPPEDCPDETPPDVRGGEPLREPIAEYGHMRGTEAFIDSSVIVGGHRYAGEAVSALQDKFVFANWSSEGVVAADGELLTATPPEDGEAPSNGADGAEEEPATNATDGGMTENATDGGTTENATTDGATGRTDRKKDKDGKHGGAANQSTEPSAGDDQDAAPDDDTSMDPVPEQWELEELVIEGAEDGQLNRYIYGVERDAEGELYVLTNTDYRPDPPTGEVFRVVPPEEGEEIPAPEEVQTVDEQAGNETA